MKGHAWTRLWAVPYFIFFSVLVTILKFFFSLCLLIATALELYLKLAAYNLNIPDMPVFR